MYLLDTWAYFKDKTLPSQDKRDPSSIWKLGKTFFFYKRHPHSFYKSVKISGLTWGSILFINLKGLLPCSLNVYVWDSSCGLRFIKEWVEVSRTHSLCSAFFTRVKQKKNKKHPDKIKQQVTQQTLAIAKPHSTIIFWLFSYYLSLNTLHIIKRISLI